MSAITLAGFEARFAEDSDPWGTRVHREERVKRDAILYALGPGRAGRVLELASGNGSNSVELAQRSLRLVATDGAQSAVGLTREALDGVTRADVRQLALPALPEGRFDAVVIAEVLYYLRSREVVALGRGLRRAVRPGGRIVLAHHHIDFDDTSCRPAVCHDLLARGLGEVLASRKVSKRHRNWRVERMVRVGTP